MRPVLLALLLLGGCTPARFNKFDRFVWGPNTEVLWLLIDGHLHRCWQHAAGGPVCMPVIFPPYNPAGGAYEKPTEPAPAKASAPSDFSK